MSINYPGGLDSTSNLKNNSTNSTLTEDTHPNLHNDVSDAIIAIETELGINPSGSYATVLARLDDGIVKTPSADQTVQPTGNTVAMSLKASPSQSSAPLWDVRASNNAIKAYCDKDGNISAVAYKVAGTALASTHLSDTAALARLAGPTFTGTPAAPTASADTNTTQIATTAFVVGQAGTATPAALGTAAAGTSLRYARQDHVHALPKLDALATPDDSTTLNATSGRHGLLPKLSGDANDFLNGVGAWASLSTQVKHVYYATFSVVNTALSTVFFDQAIDTDGLAANGSILVFVNGVYANTSGSGRTLSVRTQFHTASTTTLVWGDLSQSFASNAAGRALEWCMHFQNQALTNSQRMSGHFMLGSTDAGSLAGFGKLSVAPQISTVIGGTSAVDLTDGTTTLQLAVQHSAQSANLSLTGSVTMLVLE